MRVGDKTRVAFVHECLAGGRLLQPWHGFSLINMTLLAVTPQFLQPYSPAPSRMIEWSFLWGTSTVWVAGFSSIED